MLFGGVVCATTGAALGVHGLIPSFPGIVSGPILGAVLAATDEKFLEDVWNNSFSVRIIKTILEALGGLLMVATMFGLLFGGFALAWHLLDNPVTGPMIKWFPATMGSALETLLVPSIIAIIGWAFFHRVQSEKLSRASGYRYYRDGRNVPRSRFGFSIPYLSRFPWL